MDYYQQNRGQGSTAPSALPYVQYQTQSGAGSNSQMYYTQPMQHQQSQPSYHNTYAMQQATANSSLDYNSQHNQSSMSSHNQSNLRRGPRPQTADGLNVSGIQGGGPGQDLALRIVIDSKHVGAIIGTGGSNIREITKESKARVVVDTSRTVKDQQGHSEKIISILGHQENCSKACIKILEVVEREYSKDPERESLEVELKIRAYNQLVGRLIGKLGATIKKIMQDTGTTIYVSNEQQSSRPDMMNAPDMLSQMERTITVKGPSVEAVAAAEQRISAKLRQSYETDIMNRIVPGVPGAVPNMMNPLGLADAYQALTVTNMLRMHPNNNTTRSIKMWVPNSMVGAIIGAKGTHIRNIMRNSGANIRIEGGERKEQSESSEKAEDEEEHGQGDASKDATDKKDDERLVTISGTDVQQAKAQFWIFQRVADQTQHFLDEIKLRTELNVPSRLVGRIIGKGGQNVRELQRITGATVKIPEDEPKVDGEDKEASPTSDNEGTVVRILGTFHATHSVQSRIAQLINDFNRTSIHDRRRDDGHGDSSVRKESPPTQNGD